MAFHLARQTAAAGLALLIGLSIVAPPAHAQSASLRGYPRLGFYGSIRGTGYPFMLPDSTLDNTVLDKVARFEEITLDVNPIWPYRPDILQALRQRNPDAKMLAYVVGQDIWDARDRDSLNHYPTRYRRLMDNNDAWLYSRLTGLKYYAGNVNLAKRDSTGTLIIADSLALLWKEVAIDSGVWDGIFFDILCDEMNWPQNEGDSIDFVRAGYSTFEEFNQSWMAATDTIANRLRRWGGSGFIMVGNCALGTKYSTFNGWMREGFPLQAGGDWYSNMYWEPGGYMTDERRFRAPRHNYIFSFQVGLDPYSSLNNRIQRFGLGSATLGDGFGVFGGSDRNAFSADYHNWWYDEYAVDTNAGGVASQNPAHVGWLGQPLSPLYQMIWIGNQPDAITNSGFESNTSGWSMFTMTGAQLTRDVNASAPQGSFALRIDNPVAHPIEYAVTLRTTNAFLVNRWSTYSLTFWARVSSPRNIPTLIARASNHQLILARRLDLTTEWKQYQVPFNTYQFEGDINVEFYFGKDAGTVWIDDVHFQRGTTTVYRRDFQNGIVLVNPSTEGWVTVPLERDYKRILGVTDPVVNDGSVVRNPQLAPQDALFLIGDDVHSPAGIRDLRVISSGP